jgi:hypothetical protein
MQISDRKKEKLEEFMLNSYHGNLQLLVFQKKRGEISTVKEIVYIKKNKEIGKISNYKRIKGRVDKCRKELKDSKDNMIKAKKKMINISSFKDWLNKVKKTDI